MDDRVVDVHAVADVFGLTDRRVQQLADAGVVPRDDRGMYPLMGAVRGYIRFLQERMRRPANEDEAADRARLTAAKADLAELEADEKRGVLIRADAVRQQDFKLARILRNNLQSMPDRIAALVAAEADPTRVHEMIAGEVNQSLERVLDAMEAEQVDDAALDVTRAAAAEYLEADGSDGEEAAD